MSELIIIHRPFQSSSTREKELLKDSAFLLWETCRRQIFISDSYAASLIDLSSFDEVYTGLDAEEFLIQVLCGLKSPLVGETEVFGQFKQWWSTLTDLEFKKKYESTIQKIYSVVKKTREESLCGLGSQSYGSMLRKKLTDMKASAGPVDFIGAGQLVQEILPWIEKSWSYRVWGRQPEKIKALPLAKKAISVLSLNDNLSLSSVVVLAAPLTHQEWLSWLADRNDPASITVFDFRKDSTSFDKQHLFKNYFHLDDFTSDFSKQQEIMKQHIDRAQASILAWKLESEKRMHVRPFGWDDL